MSTLTEKLHQWSLRELNLVSEGFRTPDIESLQKLTKVKNKKIWNYVINHIRSQATVNKVKRTLFLKKQLRKKQDSVVHFVSNSTDNAKLQEAVSKATEKRKYLMRSLSAIEERIVDLDQSVRKTKDELFQINQKIALLQHLKHLYDEKNSNLRQISSQISWYESALVAYQSPKTFDKSTVNIPCDFLFENKAVYDENVSRVKDLITISSIIIKKQFNQNDENIDALTEKFAHNISELNKRGVILTDYVLLLKEIGRFDLEKFTTLNSQNLSVKEFIHEKSKKDVVKEYLTSIKSDSLYNSLSAKKTERETIKLLAVKKRMIHEVMKSAKIEPNDLDYEMRVTLFEKQAENNALLICNNNLENYLQVIVCKTNAILETIRQKKVCYEDLNSVVKQFYRDADLTYYLFYTAPATMQKIVSYLDDLKSFAHNELFDLALPEEKCVEELKGCFASDRKLMWDYCTKTKLMKPLFTDPVTNSSLSTNDWKFLNVQPYQNTSRVCESWTCFKQKLCNEIALNSETYVKHSDIVTSEVYSKIVELLDKMKFSIEKAVTFVSNGMAHCHKNKSVLEEWWTQNAQHIPPIKYEGKTLEMWINILSVLSDFEP